jgi:transcriptional regulator with XRE-family HTH domain
MAVQKREEIKAWMAEQGISLRNLAEAADRNPGTVSKFLSAQANSRPVAEALERLGCPRELLSDIAASDYICKRCKRKMKASREFTDAHDNLCTYCYQGKQAARAKRAPVHDPYETGELMTPPGVHVNDVIFCPFR